MPRSLLARRPRVSMLRAAAALTIAIGYADLVRGGTVIAPLALVAGYLILVPVSLFVE